MHVDQHGADFGQFDREAVPIGLLEQLLQPVPRDLGAGQGNHQHMTLALELHVGAVQEAQAFDRQSFALEQLFPG